jgi:hypothetical protein
MRAESAVEPTKSENITVTWRRSAVSSGSDAAGATTASNCGCALLYGFESRNRPQQLAAMAERRNTYLFEILIGQVTQDREVNIVISKALDVLGHAELFEPLRDLLHRDRYPMDLQRPSPAYGRGQWRVYSKNWRFNSRRMSESGHAAAAPANQHDELAPFQRIELHSIPRCQPGFQDIELRSLSQEPCGATRMSAVGHSRRT